MMWDDSVEIGCGHAFGNGQTYVYCYYSPRGGVGDDFAAHVHPPKTGINMQERLDALLPFIQRRSMYSIQHNHFL